MFVWTWGVNFVCGLYSGTVGFSQRQDHTFHQNYCRIFDPIRICKQCSCKCWHHLVFWILQGEVQRFLNILVKLSVNWWSVFLPLSLTVFGSYSTVGMVNIWLSYLLEKKCFSSSRSVWFIVSVCFENVFCLILN